MTSWEQAAELAEQFGGGNYIRLQDDGDNFKGMFIGDPFPWECFYNKAAEKYESWGPEQAAKGIKKGMRFGCCIIEAVWQKEAWAYEVKAWEVTVVTLKTMMECKKKYGFDRFFEVTRVGKKNDTKTSYTVLPEDPPPPELLAYCKQLQPMDIAALYSPVTSTEGAGQQQFQPGAAAQVPAAPAPAPAAAAPAPAAPAAAAPPPAAAAAPQMGAPAAAPAPAATPPQMGAPAAAPPAAAPPAAAPPAAAAAGGPNGALDHQTIHALSVVLKECPDWKTAAAEFCTHFGIQKIKDVPGPRKDEAITLAQAIAKKQIDAQQTQAPPAEVDPFEQ